MKKSLVEYLIKRGANPNLCCYLHRAVHTGRRDICHLLISYGAEVNATDEHCNRPVDIAKNQKNFHLIQYLLHNGASLFYNLDNNEPAFASAMKHKTRDLCELPTIGNLPVVFTYQDTPFLEAVKA